MYSRLNCHNVAKHIKFYLEFNVAFTNNAGCFKKALELYSKLLSCVYEIKVEGLPSTLVFSCFILLFFISYMFRS
jgi:hypothetical protein